MKRIGIALSLALVGIDSAGTYSLAYANLTIPLMGAVAQLEARLRRLEGR